LNQIDAWKKLLLLFISTPQDGMVGPNIKRWPESVGGDGSDFSFLLMCLTGGVTAGRGGDQVPSRHWPRAMGWNWSPA